MLEEGIWVAAAGVDVGKAPMWSPQSASYGAPPAQSLYHRLLKITLLYISDEKIYAIINHTGYPLTVLY
jgi:hypothetical protein